MFRALWKIEAISTGSMPSKRKPENYHCTTEVETEDEYEERPEDPTLSGGLPENFEYDADRQSLRTDNEEEEGEEDEGGQDQEELEGSY